jgi:hypothetical protein
MFRPENRLLRSRRSAKPRKGLRFFRHKQSPCQRHASVAFDMPFPFADFPLLFTSEWPARRLDDAITSLSVPKLRAEYNGVRECAPRRADQGKRYFVEHDGSTQGGSASNRREEHMARALYVLGRRWPWRGGGSLRLLDYQVPLKARRGDAGIGKIDLLGSQRSSARSAGSLSSNSRSMAQTVAAVIRRRSP